MIMINKTISRGILLAVITLLTNLSPVKVNGQTLFKKLQKAAAKEIGKKILGNPSAQTPTSINQNKPPDTLVVSQTDNNKSNNTTVTRPSNAVNAASKEEADTHPQQQKSEQNNSSPQNIRNIYVSLWGINNLQPMQSENYLSNTTKGIYFIKERSMGATFVDLEINTSLNKEELANTFVKNLEITNPKLYYLLDTTIDQVIKITISDRSLHFKTKENKTIVNVKNVKVKPDKKLEETKNDQAINDKTVENDSKEQIVQAPVEDKGTQVVEAPKTDDDDKIYTKGFEPSFPGGDYGFQIYLKENLNTNIPKKNGAPAGTYRVIVKFIVAKDGSVSEVVAENKVGYGMENEAIRVIAGGPKWDRQYTGPVNSYMRQAITFIVSK